METFKDILFILVIPIVGYFVLRHYLWVWAKSESILWTVVTLGYIGLTFLLLFFPILCLVSPPEHYLTKWECVADVYTDIWEAIQDVIDGNFIKPSFKADDWWFGKGWMS